MFRPHGHCRSCGAPTQELVIPVLPSADDPTPAPLSSVNCSSLLCPTNLVDVPA